MLRIFLCSVHFPAIFVSSRQFSVSHKIVWYSCSNLGLDRLHLTPSGSAHLFSINAGVSVCVQLVLIWLISN
jgi:hypothetical protein